MNTDELGSEIEIVVRCPPGVRRIVVSGDVDQFGAHRLHEALDEALDEGAVDGRDRIEVDPSGVTLFCSAAVTVLTHARTASGDRLRLVATAPMVDKLSRVIGVMAAFTRAGTRPGPQR